MKKSFEQSVKQIDEIVEKLENSDLEFDQILELYKQGQDLVKECKKKLEVVENKLIELDKEQIEPKITTIKGTAINSITIILIHNKLIKPPFNTPLRPNTPM